MIVLKLYDILDEVLYSLYLVMFKRYLESICIVIFISMLLCHFDLINYRKLVIEKLLIFFTEELRDRIGVE